LRDATVVTRLKPSAGVASRANGRWPGKQRGNEECLQFIELLATTGLQCLLYKPSSFKDRATGRHHPYLSTSVFKKKSPRFHIYL